MTTTTMMTFCSSLRDKARPALLAGLGMFVVSCLNNDIRRPSDVHDPEEGELVISEIHFASGAGDVDWIEVQNVSDRKLDLVVVDVNVQDAAGQSATGLEGDFIELAPQAYAVFSAAENASLAGAHVLGTDFRVDAKASTISLMVDDTVVDKVAYQHNVGWLLRTGRNLSLDPAKANAVDNDLGANWCLSNGDVAPGVGHGTPNIANPTCTECRGDSRVLGDHNWLYDPELLHTVQIEIGEAELNTLNADPLSKTYVPVNLTIGDKQFKNAALSYKGQGTLRGCFDEQGQRICDKLSMRVRFDEFDDCGRFLGLRRMKLHGYQKDPTMLHETLSYWMFRTMGILSPRASHAEVSFNGEPLGVFGLVEAVDQEFLEIHFDDDDGLIFKEVWPGHTDEERLRDALRTKRQTADLSTMLSISALVSTSEWTLADAAVQHFDLDHLMTMLAVDRAVGNDDGPTRFYCWPGKPCENHNFFWYQAPGAKLVYIPWDLDGTLWSPSMLLGPEYWSDAPRSCVPTPMCDADHLDPCPDWAKEVPILPRECNQLLNLQQPALRDRYLSASQRLAYDVLGEAAQAELSRLCTFIAPAITRDPYLTDEEFENGCAHLSELLAEQRALMIGLLEDAP